jgi:hypothetical protein
MPMVTSAQAAAPPALPTTTADPAPQAAARLAPPTVMPAEGPQAAAPVAAEPATVATPGPVVAEGTSRPETTHPNPAPSKTATPSRRATPPAPGRPTPARGTKVRTGRRRRSVTAPLVALAVVIVAAVGLIAALSGHSSPPSNSGKLTLLQRVEAANDSAAAAWVVQQVSSGTVVSCDKQMCRALEAHGFPRASLIVLGPTSPYPVKSQVVIETATVHELFGSSLDSGYAPLVLTTFGSGAAAIQIRVMAGDGAAAYGRELAADRSNRQKIGTDLLTVAGITTSPQAHAQMAAGDAGVQPLFAIAALATDEPVYVLGFGNTETGESSGVPFRYVDLALNYKASHLSSSAYLKALLKELATLQGPYRPWRTETPTSAGHVAVLRILFAAPTPLGLLGPTG